MTKPYPKPTEPSEVAQTLQFVRNELQVESDEMSVEVAVAMELPRPDTINLSEPAAVAVDELMTGTGMASEGFRARLIASVDRRLAARRRRAGLLEPLLKASRLAQKLSVDQVSAAVGLGAVEFQELEDGSRELRLQDEKVVARWIWELERDDGAAVAALERSVGTSLPFEVDTYAGRSDTGDDSPDAFVERVLRELKSLKVTTDSERERTDPSG